MAFVSSANCSRIVADPLKLTKYFPWRWGHVEDHRKMFSESRGQALVARGGGHCGARQRRRAASRFRRRIPQRYSEHRRCLGIDAGQTAIAEDARRSITIPQA